MGLVEQWVNDPSNVRLLRIGLDLWPDVALLDRVLQIINPFTKRSMRRGPQRKVALYCLAEIFRAAATETGFVENVVEELPTDINIEAYRERLDQQVHEILAPGATSLPWYVQQQVMLFVGTRTTIHEHLPRGKDVLHYYRLIRFLRNENRGLPVSEFATNAVLSKRCFCASSGDIGDDISVGKVEAIALRDPSLASEILGGIKNL